MAPKNTADTEAPKDEDRGLIHETKMLADWPRLPLLQGKTKRFVRHRARAPDGQDALQTLKHRYLVVRHLARVTKGPRVSRDFGIDSSGKTAFFWWRTGIPLKASGFLSSFGKFNPTVASPKAPPSSSSTPVTLRIDARHFPSDAKFILSGHGLYRNNVRGHITTMGSAAYGTNLVNAVEGLKARGDWRPTRIP